MVAISFSLSSLPASAPAAPSVVPGAGGFAGVLAGLAADPRQDVAAPGKALADPSEFAGTDPDGDDAAGLADAAPPEQPPTLPQFPPAVARLVPALAKPAQAVATGLKAPALPDAHAGDTAVTLPALATLGDDDALPQAADDASRVPADVSAPPRFARGARLAAAAGRLDLPAPLADNAAPTITAREDDTPAPGDDTADASNSDTDPPGDASAAPVVAITLIPLPIAVPLSPRFSSGAATSRALGSVTAAGTDAAAPPGTAAAATQPSAGTPRAVPPVAPTAPDGAATATQPVATRANGSPASEGIPPVAATKPAPISTASGASPSPAAPARVPPLPGGLPPGAVLIDAAPSAPVTPVDPPAIAAPGPRPALRLADNALAPVAVPLSTAAPALAQGVAQPAARAFAAALATAAAPRAPRLVRDDDADATLIAQGAAPLDRPATIDQPGVLDVRRENWQQRLIDRIETARDAADASDTRIRLAPDALGRIDVSLRRDGDTVHVHFAAETQATRDLLAAAQPRLAQLAESRGLKLGDNGVANGWTGGGAGQQQGSTHNGAPPSAFVNAPASGFDASENPDSDARIA